MVVYGILAVPFWTDLDHEDCSEDPQFFTDEPANAFMCATYGAISFDNIGNTLVGIFQIITLEGWTDVLYTTLNAKEKGREHGWAMEVLIYVYFWSLLFLAGLFAVNLALGVVADAYDDFENE